MKVSRLLFASAAAVLLCMAAACTKTEEKGGGETPESHSGEVKQMEFNLSIEPLSRTAMTGVGKVEWAEGDEVAFFDGSSICRMVSSGSGATASFSGEVKDSGTWYAVYPYTRSVTFSEWGGMSVPVKSTQTLSKGTFAPMRDVSFGTSSGKDMTLSHLCGVVKFTLSTSDITSVTLAGHNSEKLSGKAEIYYDKNGKPVVTVVEGENFVQALPLGGGTFEPGDYYLCLLPTTFEKGYDLFFTRASDQLSAAYSSAMPLRVTRGSISNLGTVDPSLVWDERQSLAINLPFLKGIAGSTKSWPFAESLPSGSSTESPAWPGEEKTFTFNTASGSYKFKIFASTGIAHVSSSPHGLKILGDPGDYILLPAIQGKRLSTVTVYSGSSGSMRFACIASADGSSVVNGGEPIPVVFTQAGESWTWNLVGTADNTQYRLQFTNPGTFAVGDDHSAKIQLLTLEYRSWPQGDPFEEIDPPVPGVDQVPDFSRVGYHYGEKEIPSYAVLRTLTPPAGGADATEMIQTALNECPRNGAVLLKAGKYNVSGAIYLDRSGIVLRGEGENTVIHATGDRGQDVNEVVIYMGNRNSDRVLDRSSASPIIEDAACGQFFVRVKSPGNFAVGDKVVVFRRSSQKWVEDLKMDMYGWDGDKYNMYWERIITAIDGDRIWFENPLVMEITSHYGGGALIKCSWERISESGVENIHFDCDYDPTLYDTSSDYYRKWGKYLCDEDHAWTAIDIRSAEHCWVRNVSSIHYAGCTVDLLWGAKNITVEDCRSDHPISMISGNRRYAFFAHKCELCLFRRCSANMDRHAFVTGHTTAGPNVYTRCSATNMYEEVGPHQRWATGLLFDKVTSDHHITIQDRANAGDGHGWAGANFVMWNCDIVDRTDGNTRLGYLVCQNPWVSAHNWAFGCGPESKIINHTRSYTDGITRLDGEWVSKGVHMPEESLYEWQFSRRVSLGIKALDPMINQQNITLP